jgi:hypothetical protein
VPKHVFTNKPSGPGDRDNVASCRPEPAVIARAESEPGKAFSLAWVAGTEDGDRSKSGKRLWFSDIPEVWNAGKPTPEHAAGVGLDFAETDGAEASRPGGNGEASNSTEKVEVSEVIFHTDSFRGQVMR